MKKKEYEVPLTRYLEVEMEQGFMNGSLGDDPTDTESITINEQTKGITIGGSASDGYDSFSNYDKWDDQIQP